MCLRARTRCLFSEIYIFSGSWASARSRFINTFISKSNHASFVNLWCYYDNRFEGFKFVCVGLIKRWRREKKKKRINEINVSANLFVSQIWTWWNLEMCVKLNLLSIIISETFNKYNFIFKIIAGSVRSMRTTARKFPKYVFFFLFFNEQNEKKEIS